MKSSVLKHPAAILAGVALGVVIGIYNAPLSSLLGIGNFARIIAVPGQLYLFYLQMTVIPIIITAIASSLGRLVRNKSGAGLISRMAMVLVICLIITALAGMALGMIGKPGAELDESTRNTLSNLISASGQEGAGDTVEINLRSGQQINAPPQGPSLMGFFRDLIPSNIFQALSTGSTMAIVFFSIIFGVAVGILKEDASSLLINLLAAVFDAFQKIINWSLYLLPFGLICLMAGQIADVGPQIFMAMSKFIILYVIGTAAIFIIATVVIWLRSGIANPFKALSLLFEPILLAFATRNSMAVLPSAITCLDKEMGFNSNAVNLTLPLGMTLGRFGNTFYFALGVFFVAQIYNTPLELMHYLIIFIGCIFSGAATAGASGIVTLSAISIVLNPLGLPVEAVLVIFMAIDTIIDPFRTFLIVYVNMAAASLVARQDGGAEGGAPARKERERTDLVVYIGKPRDRPPFLYRQGGAFDGLEIELLREIARRLNRKLEFAYTGAGGRPEPRPDILAGLITNDGELPKGFVLSRPWARITEDGVRKEACFLLAGGNSGAARIDGVLKELNEERFLAARHPRPRTRPPEEKT